MLCYDALEVLTQCTLSVPAPLHLSRRPPTVQIIRPRRHLFGDSETSTYTFKRGPKFCGDGRILDHNPV